jgi:hypothetical protein
MITPSRDRILRQLERVSALTPEFRFGQLIANLAFLAKGPWDQTLWELEDDELAAALDQFLEDLSRRKQPAASAM